MCSQMKLVHSSCCSLYRAMMELRKNLVGVGGRGGVVLEQVFVPCKVSLVLRLLDSL